MFAAILNTAVNLIEGRRAERKAEKSALAAEQRQLQYNRDALADQRAYDEKRYGVERADSQADVENQFVNLRTAAEKAGFNPLAVLGSSGVPSPVSRTSGVPLAPAAQSVGYIPPTDYMGSAIAEAGLALSDSFMRSEFRSNAGKLEANRERLRRTKEAMQRDTIRPKVGGVYAQREQTRSMAQALGRTDGDRYGSPSFETRGRGYRPNADHPLTASLGDVAVPDPTLDRGTGLYMGGFQLEAPPGWSNGQQLENELGEIGSILPQISYAGAYAGWNTARYYEHITGKANRKPRMRKDQAGRYYNPRGLPGYDNLTGSRPSERFR
jgi:hypothetical protein